MSESEYTHQPDSISALASNDTTQESNAQGQAGQAITAVDEAILSLSRCGGVAIRAFESTSHCTHSLSLGASVEELPHEAANVESGSESGALHFVCVTFLASFRFQTGAGTPLMTTTTTTTMMMQKSSNTHTVMRKKKMTALTSSTTTTTTSLTAVPALMPPLASDALTTSEIAGACAFTWRASDHDQFKIVTFMFRPHSRLQDGCSMLRQRVRRLPKARLFISSHVPARYWCRHCHNEAEESVAALRTIPPTSHTLDRYAVKEASALNLAHPLSQPLFGLITWIITRCF